MATERIKIGDKIVKVALEPAYAYLAENADKKVGTLLKDSAFIALLTAQRGGGSSEENWLEVAGSKVGRVCAMLGAWYIHDNEDKEASHFYRNGSYHIVIEKLKNLKTKAHKAEQAKQLEKLEDDMMEEVITPKEWKAQKDEVLKEYKFEVSDETKAYLVELTKGYESKEALATAIADGTAVKYADISDDVEKYLATVEAELFPTPTEETPTEDNAEA